MTAPRRRALRAAKLAVGAGIVFVAVPALAGVPARLVQGCGDWIAAAGGLELLSAVGFVVLFKLVFAARLGWRRSVPAALRALAASTVLPGGSLIGPTLGAWSTGTERPSLSRLSRSAIAFTVLTNAPGAIVLAALGVLLWLGLPGGPHQSALTILPAVVAIALLASGWVLGRSADGRPTPARRSRGPRTLAAPGRAVTAGVGEAHALVVRSDWKLYGAVAAYVFDNAVLWAAFHAFGATPPIGVIVMGYLVGSLAGALPVPAGLGAVEGGLIGALALYGAPAAPAAAAVLLYRGVSLLLPVALGVAGTVFERTARRLPLIRAVHAARTPAAGLTAAGADGH